MHIPTADFFPRTKSYQGVLFFIAGHILVVIFGLIFLCFNILLSPYGNQSNLSVIQGGRHSRLQMPGENTVYKTGNFIEFWM